MTSAAETTYRKGVYINAVIEAASRAGVRLSTMTVLFYLCKWSKSYGPFVDQAKPQIMAELGLCDKTVKQALAALSALGIVVPHENRHGGAGRGNKGRGVTRRLVILGSASGGKGGKSFPENGGKVFQKTGEKNYPHNASNIKQGKEEGAARGGGGFRPVLDVAQEGNTHGAQGSEGREIDQDARAEYRRALLACDGNAYKALALVDQWRAEREATAQATERAMNEEGGSAGEGDQATALAES